MSIATFDVGQHLSPREYAEYKATRAETPDDLRVQFGRIQELTAALWASPSSTREGYEADDVLGTLSRLGDRPGPGDDHRHRR